MTPLQQKQRKVKLLGLIIICDLLLWKKDTPKGILEIISRTQGTVYWLTQLRIVQSQPIPPIYIKGSKNIKTGLAIVGNSDREEIIKKP